MSERIKCPSCSVGLSLPEAVRGSPATCPRCLAMVSVPETGREPDAIQSERSDRREEPLRGLPDIDVRRDTKGTSCLVVALAVIGGLGLGLLGLDFLLFATNGFYPPLLFLAVSLLILAGISTLRSRGNPGATGFRRVAVGTLALAGVIILVIPAVGVCFFVVCMAATRGRGF